MEGVKGGREAKSREGSIEEGREAKSREGSFEEGREGSIEEGREGGKEQGKLNMQSIMRVYSENTTTTSVHKHKDILKAIISTTFSVSHVFACSVPHV